MHGLTTIHKINRAAAEAAGIMADAGFEPVDYRDGKPEPDELAGSHEHIPLEELPPAA